MRRKVGNIVRNHRRRTLAGLAASALALMTLVPSAVSCAGASGEQEEAAPKECPLGFDPDTLVRVDGKVAQNEYFSTLLSRLGLPSRKANALISSCGEVFDVRKFRSGRPYAAYYRDSLRTDLHYLVYSRDRLTDVIFSPLRDSVWTYSHPVTKEQDYADVTIETSLWNDMTAAGASPLLILELSDIYAWTVDFFGLQKGDRFRVFYDKTVCDGDVIAIDTVRFAVYTHSGTDSPMLMFNQGDGGNIYWNEKGESMRKAFLKAPLHYSRISSGFSYARRHPITRVVKPHTGVDYAAPLGTPVMSIGDGTVVSAKYEGAGGNTVRIRHNSVYTTAYLHLSKYGKGIRAGARVQQGQVIGYVGSTGGSTGPHLDFRVWKNGSPVNPLRMESPPAEPLRKEFREAFDSLYASFASRVAELQDTTSTSAY